jgi:iron complex transport system ATP-binding protein
MLEARGVCLRRGGRSVLHDVSVSLAPAALVAVVGPNGAGKSSLLGILAGEICPDHGAATLDGRLLQSFSAAELAARRAVLEQSPSVFAPFTVAELVALGTLMVPRASTREPDLVARAMAIADIGDLASRPADRLSGGERARAHFARVLAQVWAGRAAGMGRFLLLDEPTASLDLSHQITLMNAARAASRNGVGVLAVLHDLNLAAAYCDHVVLLANGACVSQGSPRMVFDAARLTAVYRTPVSVSRMPDGQLQILPLYGDGRPLSDGIER